MSKAIKTIASFFRGKTKEEMESIEAMRQAERDCATCPNRCAEPLEYPEAIASKIDHDGTMALTAKITRFEVIICSGISASKWPADIAVNGSYAAELSEHAKDLSQQLTTEQNKKMRISVKAITLSSHDDGNPEEACDLIIFPERVIYRSVFREQMKDVLTYHTTVIAPRYDVYRQDFLDKKITFEEYKARAYDVIYPKVTDKVITDDNNSNPVPHIPENISPYFTLDDVSLYQCGNTIPYPRLFGYKTIILLCGHKLRDKRCGVVAPILQQQFEEVLDHHIPNHSTDVFIDLVSHIGGHKYAGNVIIYSLEHEWEQVWYGRIYPEHVENIVLKTIINGEIMTPLSRGSILDTELF